MAAGGFLSTRHRASSQFIEAKGLRSEFEIKHDKYKSSLSIPILGQSVDTTGSERGEIEVENPVFPVLCVLIS